MLGNVSSASVRDAIYITHHLAQRLSRNEIATLVDVCDRMWFHRVVETELEHQPMWTAATPAQHSGDGLGFASDLTDTKWAIVAPPPPAGCLAGRPPRWPWREIINAIFYILPGGVPWRMLQLCFPPRQTVYGWFAAWRDAGIRQQINHHPVMRDRERSGREASPSAAVVDSQSVKTT